MMNISMIDKVYIKCFVDHFFFLQFYIKDNGKKNNSQEK